MMLSICPETRLKNEKLARPRQISHVLNFMKAQIGYCKGGVAEYLSRTKGGVRFLCFAAALGTLKGHSQGLK